MPITLPLRSRVGHTLLELYPELYLLAVLLVPVFASFLGLEGDGKSALYSYFFVFCGTAFALFIFMVLERLVQRPRVTDVFSGTLVTFCAASSLAYVFQNYLSALSLWSVGTLALMSAGLMLVSSRTASPEMFWVRSVVFAVKLFFIIAAMILAELLVVTDYFMVALSFLFASLLLEVWAVLYLYLVTDTHVRAWLYTSMVGLFSVTLIAAILLGLVFGAARG